MSAPGPLRALVVSHAYADPERRGKLRALAGLGCSIAAAVPDRWQIMGEEFRAEWSDDGGVRIAPIEVRGTIGDPADVSWKRGGIRRIIRDFRPDLVQVEEEPWTQAAAVATRLAVRARVPVVLFGAGSIPNDRGFRARRRRNRTLGRASGLLGANSTALSLLATDHPDLPAGVLPQIGTPVPAPIQQSGKEGLTIGYVGRLVPERGLDLLLRACTRLYGPWTMLVSGSGPAQESMERLAEQFGLSSRISWLGALPAGEMAAVWPRLDCLVYPARATPDWVEVTGRVVLQAMGRGIPVVGTATGALPDVIGDAGVVVPPEDVEAMTAALQDLQQNPTRREQLGEAGRRRVLADFSDAAVGRRTLSFWHQVTGRTPVP